MNLPDPQEREEIEVRELADLLASGRTLRLLDCREDDEFAFNRIPGGEHVALARFAELAPERLREESGPIVVYCHHGGRSVRATRWLRSKGWPDTFSLKGGIDQWALQVDPTIPRY